jgi:hypothetical protein
MDQLPDGLHGRISQKKQQPFLDGNFFAIRGSETIEKILLSFSRIKFFPLEDVFLTGLVADFAAIPRFGTVRFSASGWRTADGCWLVQQVIFSDLSGSDFGDLWHSMSEKSRLDCRSGDGCCEDGWGLVAQLAPVWLLMLLLQISILHTTFWSSFALFCSDLCSAMDTGMDDEDLDSDTESVADLYGTDGERDVGDTSLFDIHRPRDILHIDRF